MAIWPVCEVCGLAVERDMDGHMVWHDLQKKANHLLAAAINTSTPVPVDADGNPKEPPTDPPK